MTDKKIEEKNINDATREDIAKIPFIGEQRAEMIVHYREKNGPYTRVQDLEKITGFNQTMAQRIGEYFTFSSKEPTAKNKSSTDHEPA